MAQFVKLIWRPFLMTSLGYSAIISAALAVVAKDVKWFASYPAVSMISAFYLLCLGLPVLYVVWIYSQKKQAERSDSFAVVVGFGGGTIAYLILNTVLNVLASEEISIVHEPWTTLGISSAIGGGYGLLFGFLFSRNSGFAINQAEQVAAGNGR